jgi:hypothetical protein
MEQGAAAFVPDALHRLLGKMARQQRVDAAADPEHEALAAGPAQVVHEERDPALDFRFSIEGRGDTELGRNRGLQ